MDSPVGIADVVLGKMAWSMKTVKNASPFRCKNIRLISGRCSPDYSYGITDPHKDIQETGRDCLFEEENHRYRTSDYMWEVNSNGNLIGKEVETGRMCFTWQPHGSQFTIHTTVPDNAVKFRIKRPPSLAKEVILDSLGFDESWIEIIKGQELI